MSQEDEDTSVHEDDLSLSFSERPLELHCGDSLIMDIVQINYKGGLDFDSCQPRYRLSAFPNNTFQKYHPLTCLHVPPVSRRRRETACWSPDRHLRHHPSSAPSSPLSNQQCATMRRRLGRVTSTSLSLTQMDPVQSTLFMCFLHCFR